MQIIGAAFVVAALACWAGGCVSYFRCIKVHDVMGASFSFSAMWVIGSGLITLALKAIFNLPIWPSVGTCVGLVTVGKLIEWFVLDLLIKQPPSRTAEIDWIARY